MNNLKNKKLIILVSILIIIFLITVFKPMYEPLDSSEMIGVTEKLKKGDKIIQKIKLSSYSTREILFREATYSTNVDYINFDIKLFDQKNKLIKKQNYDYKDLGDLNYIKFSLDNEKLFGDYILEIDINDIKDDSTFTFYTAIANDNRKSYLLNNNEVGGQSLSLVIGGNKKSYYYSWILFIIILILFVIIFNKNIKENYFNKLNEFLNKKISLFIYLVISLIDSFTILYVYKILDFSIFRSLLFIISLFLSILIIYYFVYNMSKNNIKIEKIFLLLAIPIGTMYTLYIMPFEVPDSQYHYTSAFQLAKGNLGNKDKYMPKVMTDNYYNLKIKYKDYVELVNTHYDYKDTVMFDRFSIYNGLDYVPAALGILIGIILNLSPYIGTYLAKYLTYITFLLIGYFIIKKLPVGKKTMMIYLLSPMFLSQATSFSVDAMINIFSLLFFAYIMYLYHEKKDIEYKDIIILTASLGITSIQKIVYLFMGVFVLLLWPLVKKMDNKKKMFTIFCTIGLIAVPFTWYYLTNKHSLNAVIQPGIINSHMYILENLYRAVYAIVNTLLKNGSSYILESIGSLLGWSYLGIPDVAMLLYTVAIAIGIMSEKEVKFKISKFFIFILLLVFIVEMLLVVLAMFSEWSYIGNMVITGIQGRYFIPINFIILFIIILKNKFHIKEDTKNIIAYLIIVLNIISLITIMQFY